MHAGTVRKHALAWVVSAALTASCAGSYYASLRSNEAARRPSDEPALPTVEWALAPCPAGTRLVDRTSPGAAAALFERFCADAHGDPEGMLLSGLYDPSTHLLRVQAGTMHGGRVEGRWVVIAEAGFFEGSYHDGHPVGAARARRERERASGSFDAQGLMDGAWEVDGRAVVFAHGSGPVAWRDYNNALATGECHAGLRTGRWRLERDGDVREFEYREGVVHGAVRFTHAGEVVGEGEVADGVLVRWRGMSGGGCRATITQVEGCIVDTPCVDPIAPFRWACEYEAGVCRHPMRVRDDGTQVPLVDEVSEQRRAQGMPVESSMLDSLRVDLGTVHDSRCPLPPALVMSSGFGVPHARR